MPKKFFYQFFLKKSFLCRSYYGTDLGKGNIDMTSINTNVGALNARASAVRATGKMEAQWSDYHQDCALTVLLMMQLVLAVAGKMESQLRGINMSIRNAQDGVGLIQTGEAGLNEIRNMVLRIRELAVQMANGIYEDTPDRSTLSLKLQLYWSR
jgi:flagellin